MRTVRKVNRNTSTNAWKKFLIEASFRLLKSKQTCLLGRYIKEFLLF